VLIHVAVELERLAVERLPGIVVFELGRLAGYGPVGSFDVLRLDALAEDA
jgi:hypothetical protein